MGIFFQHPRRNNRQLVLEIETGYLIGGSGSCATFNNRPQDIERLKMQPQPNDLVSNETLRRALVGVLMFGEQIAYVVVSKKHIEVTYNRPYTAKDVHAVFGWCQQIQACSNASVPGVQGRVCGPSTGQSQRLDVEDDADELDPEEDYADELDPEPVEQHHIVVGLAGVAMGTDEVLTVDSDLFELADRWLVMLTDDASELDSSLLTDLLLDLHNCGGTEPDRATIREMFLRTNAGETVDLAQLQDLLRRFKLNSGK